MMFGSPVDSLDTLDKSLQATKDAIIEPLLLPIVLLEEQLQSRNASVRSCHREIFDVECSTRMRTGLQKWGYEEHFQVINNLAKSDLTRVTQILNSVISRLAFSKMHCHNSASMLKFVDENLNSLRSTTASKIAADYSYNNDPLIAKIQHLTSWCEGIDSRCTYIIKRAEAQVQTVNAIV
jgi:hypothetical protein